MSHTGEPQQDFDVIILGAGSAGTVLGAILARHDVRVLLIDAAVHPKFAVGESTTLYTLKGYRQLAERYGIPELEYLTSYEGAWRTSARPPASRSTSASCCTRRGGARPP